MNAAGVARGLLNARKSGAGWLVRCPAHTDRNPSLSIRDSAAGQILVRCHAGCPQDAVVGALKHLGLWPERERINGQRRIVAEYNYRDQNGSLVYQVVRTDPKGFFQRYRDTAGGWLNRKHPQQMLYRLEEVATASVVFVCEGEKDVDRLRDYGFVATTNAGGANARWLPQYTEALSGREVILIPDNDAPGRKRVLTIARALIGRVPRIQVLELIDGKDVSDWFDCGHSEVELVELIRNERKTHGT